MFNCSQLFNSSQSCDISRFVQVRLLGYVGRGSIPIATARGLVATARERAAPPLHITNSFYMKLVPSLEGSFRPALANPVCDRCEVSWHTRQVFFRFCKLLSDR